MNRTFSLNNVSDVGTTTPSPGVGVGVGVRGVVGAQPTQLNGLNGQNIVLPLTQASLSMANAAAAAAAVSSSSFSNVFGIQHSRTFGNANNDDSMIRMTLMNNASKFNSKYASSNYLNDYSSPSRPLSQQHIQPHHTRTTPRRRTPRNAEEFLKASGVVDTQTFLNKGYYVGSMFNLNEINKNSNVMSSNTNLSNNHHQQNGHTNNNNNNNNNPSSSSSSSTTGFKLHHNNEHIQQQQLLSNLKRRNSIHDTTSVSLANLNFLNINPSSINEATATSPNNIDCASINSSSKNSSYYRNNTGYNKNRSATTAILPSTNLMTMLNHHHHHNDESDHHESSNGSSAPGSDSSSSPVPLKQQQQQQQHLGPLMSAVSKLESESSSPLSSNKHDLHRYENDVYDDDYEYLERNLGAEPFNSPTLDLNQQTQNKLNNNETNTTTTTTTTTTTNTNVTDYYTDESYSFGNSDDVFKQQQHLQQQQKYLNSDYQQQSSSTIHNTTPQHLSSKTNYIHQQQHQTQINSNNMIVPTTWDHTSLASSNSLFSGL